MNILSLQKADRNGDGRLSADEYYDILKEHGVDCSKEEIMHIMQIADKDHDGFISREEFLGEKPSTSHRKKSVSDETNAKADLAFNVFDKNHDGFITKDEMLKMSKNITKAQVDAVFARNDENHDGKLTREEFQDFMHKRKNSK